MSNISIPTSWSSGRTLDLFYIKGRLGWKGLRASEFQGEGPFLITGTDFVGGKVDWSRSFHISDARFIESPEIIVQPRDILITKDGTIGKVAFIERIPFPGKASLNSHLFLVRSRTKKIDQRFASYIFQSYLFRRFIETNKLARHYQDSHRGSLSDSRFHYLRRNSKARSLKFFRLWTRRLIRLRR